MERQDIDDEPSTTGAPELLAFTSAAHLAYLAEATCDSSQLFWTGDKVGISSAATSPKVSRTSAKVSRTSANASGGVLRVTGFDL
jgi:hypothetical protein